MSGTWDGWTWNKDDDFILDDAGNHYYQGEIRALFYLRQWHGSQKGNLDKKKIRFLRDELDSQISLAKTRNKVTVTIDWGDQKESIVHPFFRKIDR